LCDSDVKKGQTLGKRHTYIYIASSNTDDPAIQNGNIQDLDYD